MISVIIPAYNSEAYMRQCLDSLLAQTCRDWEAIVVNDGSTDSTAEIVNDYVARDGRFRLLSISNSGLASARNVGLEASRGEWIAFLDSDDAFMPHALELLLHGALSTGSSISCGAYRIVSDIPTHEPTVTTVPAVEVKNGRDGLLDILYQLPRGVSPSVCDKLWSREFIGDERFLDGVYYEDLEFSTRMISRADKLALVNEEVYYYRANPLSFLHTFSEHRFDCIKVTMKIERDHEADPTGLRAARERTMSAAFNILWMLTVKRERRRAYSDMADRCWEIIRERRWASVINRQVRAKNRCAALLSYLGRPLTEGMLRLGNRFAIFNPPQTY